MLLVLMEALVHLKKAFSINFSKTIRKFCLSLYYNADNIEMTIEIFNFNANNKNVNLPTQFCLRSISNGISAIECREVSLNGNVYKFLVDYNSIDESDI